MDYSTEDGILASLLGSMGMGQAPEEDKGITALLSPAANMTATQERVDWAMANDPAFRASMQEGQPKAGQEKVVTKDPLAADANGWNLTKTGQVNTDGAMQRVNARAKAEGTGVTATRDDSGQLVLSNVGTTGVNGGGAGMVAATTPNGISGSLAALRQTSDPATAAGIMSNLRQSAAEESSRLSATAQKFASDKLGVPRLMSYLEASEANDRAAPEWFPGIGDSPGTARIRAELNTTRSAADLEAKRYLDSNTSAAALRATMLTADQEFKRIERIGDRMDRGAERMADRKEIMAANADMRAQEQRDKQDAEDAATLGAMTPEVIARLAILNPSLGNESDKTSATARMFKDAAKNKSRVAALQATGSQLPVLALSGNPDAISIIAAKEISTNPGLTQEAVEGRLAKIRDRANSPGFDADIIKSQFGDATTPEAKKALGDLRMGRVGMDATAKEQDRMRRFEAALEMERKATTSNFMKDVGSWSIPGNEAFEIAKKQAMNTTGRRDMESVLTAYIGGLTGPAALVKLSEFNNLVEQAASKQGQSLFGMPDPVIIKAAAIKRGREEAQFIPGKRDVSSIMSSMPAGIATGGELFGGLD